MFAHVPEAFARKVPKGNFTLYPSVTKSITTVPNTLSIPNISALVNEAL